MTMAALATAALTPLVILKIDPQSDDVDLYRPKSDRGQRSLTTE
jgi:hypothetical protein